MVALAAADKLSGFPFQNESLRYNVNWPSGLSLGEAIATASHSDNGWNFSTEVSVGAPGFPIADKYNSSATIDLCSIELLRDLSHGNKKVSEKTTFDQKNGTAQRQTLTPAGGGKSELSFHGCGRDAMAYWFFARRELGQGRVPAAETVFFGSGCSNAATRSSAGRGDTSSACGGSRKRHCAAWPRSGFRVKVRSVATPPRRLENFGIASTFRPRL